MQSPLPGFKAQKTQKPGSEQVQWLFLSTKYPFPLIQTGRGEPVNYRILCVIINYKYKQKKGNYNYIVTPGTINYESFFQINKHRPNSYSPLRWKNDIHNQLFSCFSTIIEGK